MTRTIVAAAFAWALGLMACSTSGPASPTPGSPDAAAAGEADARPSSAGLPLVVDDYYAASGYMGDGSQPGAISDDECSERAGDGRGLCHHFTWQPAGMNWAGVFWQFPEGNWGSEPGLDMPAGATRVSFYAWGASGGELVGFMVGMGDVDGFEVKQENIALTAQPAQYTLSLDSTGYSEVVGGFGWVAADSTAEVEFYVDDIVWE